MIRDEIEKNDRGELGKEKEEWKWNFGSRVLMVNKQEEEIPNDLGDR